MHYNKYRANILRENRIKSCNFVEQLGLLFYEMETKKPMGVSTKGFTECLMINGSRPGDAHDLFNVLLMKLEESMPKLSDLYRFLPLKLFNR